jgi:hypothetical protein
MKTIALFLVLYFCLVVAACGGPVKELDDYLNLKDQTILEMDKKIEANPTKTGVDEARKVYESKKEDLKAKCAALKDKKLSSDQTKKMLDHPLTTKKMLDLTQARIKDTDANLEFTKLINDFNGTCK